MYAKALGFPPCAKTDAVRVRPPRVVADSSVPQTQARQTTYLVRLDGDPVDGAAALEVDLQLFGGAAVIHIADEHRTGVRFLFRR